jgi:hypothetical protein
LQPGGSSQVLPADEAKAWRKYLSATRKLVGDKYERVEPWAWKRLQNELLAIYREREKVA